MAASEGIWARIEAGHVRELTSIDPTGRFVAAMQWIDASKAPDVALGWTWDGNHFAPPAATAASLPEARAALARYRFDRETAGIAFQTKAATSKVLIATDRPSQAKIAAAAAAAAAGHWVAGTPWKAADGSFVALTADDAQAMAAAVITHVAACYAREATLSAQLGEDATLDITQGWPPAS